MKRAIAVVTHHWDSQQPLPLSAASYQKIEGQLDSGDRILIYQHAPVNAIIAEAEVVDAIAQKIDDWPDSAVSGYPTAGFGDEAAYLLPLRVLYSREGTNRIPQVDVRDRLEDPAFPSAEFMFVDATEYDRLNDFP
jgi:hypothetical protein